MSCLLGLVILRRDLWLLVCSLSFLLCRVGLLIQAENAVMRLLRLGDPEGLGVLSLQHPLAESNQVIRKLESEQYCC